MNTISKMLNRVLLACLLTMLSCVLWNDNNKNLTIGEKTLMERKTVETELKIIVSKNSVIANIMFINISPKDIYLEKINACLSGEIENDVFEISSEGKKIEYVGPLTKRLPPGPEDVVLLSKGDSITTSVNLCEAYEFKKRGIEYCVTYSAYHSSPVGATPLVLSKIVSNKAMFQL